MPERPLLVFPTPEPSERVKRQTPFPSPSIPNHSRLIDRQRPKFATLVRTFREGLFSVNTTATGIEPEKALVIELNGGIRSFLSLCEQTEGIEFIADYTLEEIEEDPDYPDAKKGKFILSMTNSRGLSSLLSLWNRFKKNKDVEFPRGLTQWKQIFEQLRDIRYWGVKERLEETGTLDNWKFEIDEFGKEIIRTEVELFFRNTLEKREEIEDEIKALCSEINGRIEKKLVIPQIRYHGLLISIPKRAVEQIADQQTIRLVNCDHIMYFRPVGQSVPHQNESELTEDIPVELEFETSEPRLAVLDGLPIQNHEKIRSHINVVDPDGFEEKYPAIHRKHGTSMVSLIINGDLEDEEDGFLPDSSIYLRPIMMYDSLKNREMVPEGELLIDLLHRAVVDMKDDHARANTKQNSIQVINLSVGDPMRLFHWELSSLARLLDWLSWRYNVLFIVSAGNHPDSIVIKRSVNGIQLQDLPEEQQRELLFRRLHEIQRFRRLMAPAEAINVITVGAIHKDNTDSRDPITDLIGHEIFPASYNPISYGFRKAVKPEIFCPGGKSVFMLQPSDNDHYRAELYNGYREPGLKVAFPSTRGITNGIAYTRGTSNAAALTSRNALKIIEMLDELNAGEQVQIAESYYPVVIKTLLAHSCAWDNSYDHLERILKTNNNTRDFKKVVQKYVGYGLSDINRSLECLENRATIIGVGTLNKDEGHRYIVPVPQCFHNTRVDRRLILTLSWISPLNMEHAFYRRAHLTLEKEGIGQLVRSSVKEAHAHSIVKGTIEHRIEKSRSRVQLNGDENITLKVTCREDAGVLDDPVRYALAVTIENLENVVLPVYEQIRERIGVRIRPQV